MKKLLYAVMLAALPVVFQACVDDTESPSVTAIREAKAAQMKAAAAVDQANAEASASLAAANAALITAQAAVENANAAKILAEAEGQKIQNRLDSVYVELQKVKLDEERLNLERLKYKLQADSAKYAADIAEAEARAQKAAADLEWQLKLIEAQLQEAANRLLQAQMEGLQKEASLMNTLIGNYQTAASAYNLAVADVVNKQRALFDAKNDTIKVNELIAFHSANIVGYQNDIENAEQQIALWEEYSGVSADELADKVAEAKEAAIAAYADQQAASSTWTASLKAAATAQGVVNNADYLSYLQEFLPRGTALGADYILIGGTSYSITEESPENVLDWQGANPTYENNIYVNNGWYGFKKDGKFVPMVSVYGTTVAYLDSTAVEGAWKDNYYPAELQYSYATVTSAFAIDEEGFAAYFEAAPWNPANIEQLLKDAKTTLAGYEADLKTAQTTLAAYQGELSYAQELYKASQADSLELQNYFDENYQSRYDELEAAKDAALESTGQSQEVIDQMNALKEAVAALQAQSDAITAMNNYAMARLDYWENTYTPSDKAGEALQAAKVKEYRALMISCADQWWALENGDLKAAKEALADFEEEIAANNEAYDQALAEFNAFEPTYNAQLEAVNEIFDKTEGYYRQVNGAEADVADAEDEIETIEDDIDAQKKVIAGYEAQLAGADDTGKDLQAAYKALQEQVSYWENAVKTLNSAIETAVEAYKASQVASAAYTNAKDKYDTMNTLANQSMYNGVEYIFGPNYWNSQIANWTKQIENEKKLIENLQAGTASRELLIAAAEEALAAAEEIAAQRKAVMEYWQAQVEAALNAE